MIAVKEVLHHLGMGSSGAPTNEVEVILDGRLCRGIGRAPTRSYFTCPWNHFR